MNEDVCLVSFKRFIGNSEQVYPTITIGIVNPILQKKLDSLWKSQYNTSSYKRYIEGYYFDDDLEGIHYDDVTVSINYCLIAYHILQLNQGLISYDKMEGIGQSNWMGPYVRLRNHRIKCFSFDILFNEHANIHGLAITLHPNMFTNGTRPPKLPQAGDLELETRGVTFSLHLKWQLLMSYATIKASWNKRKPNVSKAYIVVFAVK